MTKREKSRMNNKGNLKGCLTFSGAILFIAIISPLPVAIVDRTAKEYNATLYVGFLPPLLLIGMFLAIELQARLFRQFKPVPIFNSWKDYLTVYLAFVTFCVIEFLPVIIGIDSIFAYILSFLIASPIAILLAYLFGTSDLKQKIREFPKGFKRKRSLHKKL